MEIFVFVYINRTKQYMPDAREIYARRLYKDLRQRFGYKATIAATLRKMLGGTLRAGNTLLSIEGAGVHWNCSVERGERLCTIHCFNTEHGGEYYISFEVAEKNVAYGRSSDKTQAIDAVEDWLNYLSLEQLYARHSFVDDVTRTLEIVRAMLLSQQRALADQSQHRLEQDFAGSYLLYFDSAVRGCRISASATHTLCVFYWDGARIFETSELDINRLGILIKKWVCDVAMPSELQKEFPEVDFGRLSTYYEQGNGIGGEFILSWNALEEFYEDINLNNRAEILQLIKTMRAKGFDKTFRAGTSLYSFILSRSRRYGLRLEQPRVRFDFIYIKSVMQVDYYGENGAKHQLSFNTIEYNEAIENLLKELEHAEIS